MAIIDNPVFREISEIFADGAKPVNFKWRCQIHGIEETVQPTTIVSIEIDRNYRDNISDQILIQVMMPEGDFDHVVFPSRETLQVTLIRDITAELGGDSSEGRDVRTQRYRAQLIETESSQMMADSPTKTDRETSNLRDMKNFTLQLLDVSIEQIRLMSTGGIFRDVKTADVVRTVLGNVSKQVDVSEEYSIKGVDVAENFSQRVWPHVIIPHHTKLTGLARYVQEEAGGVYGAGIGMYLQNQIWYVFPPFNLKRFDTARNTVTILTVPEKLMPGVERTYRVVGDQTYIISTGQVKHRDPSDEQQLNLGNGLRYIDAEKVVENFVEIEDNKATAVRKSNNVEMILNQRKTGFQNIVMASERASSNHPAQYSQVSARNGAYLMITWDNADSTILKPGQGTRFLYPVSDKLMEVKGVIQDVKYFIQNKGNAITGSFINTAVISIFVEREPVQA